VLFRKLIYHLYNEKGKIHILLYTKIRLFVLDNTFCVKKIVNQHKRANKNPTYLSINEAKENMETSNIINVTILQYKF
jgi:hypothetical protein